MDVTAALLDLPLTLVFLAWSGWILSAKRITRRDLVPFAAIGGALFAAYRQGIRSMDEALIALFLGPTPPEVALGLGTRLAASIRARRRSPW